jgi:glucose-1-phosphate cytidylyltransferase
MKAVILAGGLGTRFAEETSLRPKPMIEIGGRPILWHIMKIYAAHGVTEFVICCGYKGYVIKEYFANYFLHMSDVTFDMHANDMVVHKKRAEPWKVTLVDTGDDSMTGGRLKRVVDHVRNEELFLFTYGDGVGDIDITRSIAFHREHGKAATLTATYPPGRFGALQLVNGQVVDFLEKPQGDGGMINGGYFVLNPSGSKSRCATWRMTDNSWRTSITAFGSRWIRCAINSISMNCGTPEGRHGTYGRGRAH